MRDLDACETIGGRRRPMTTPLRALALVAGAMLATTVFVAAQTPPEGQNAPPPYRPGLGDLMTMTVQPRHIKLALAGREKNWVYAAYELHQLVGGVNPILFASRERELYVPRLHCHGHEIAEAGTIRRRGVLAFRGRLGSNEYRGREHRSGDQGQCAQRCRHGPSPSTDCFASI